MSDIAGNLDTVRETIRKAEAASGRPEGSVKLMAVSKFHPAEAVIDAIKASQTLFGENRVQEGHKKFLEVRERGYPWELHFIGTMQRNKVKQAVALASCIQSVDRIEVLEEIEKQAARLGRTIRVLFELHTGEETKTGFHSREELARCVEFSASLEHVIPSGFMTMAPFTEDEKAVRASFVTLRQTAETLGKLFPGLPLSELSMGMSGDYRIAIEEGSTLVRIGTAIFGERRTE
ncbi:MAG: YggS family pyridoxal phosphate-dependent enzyme [Spirochaetaceae bacterium]|jgi:pyridoxal phosphate enzyme (YggS family)|nr:YggS family pyridoxal phosphate-dependent enzyme [Spirochaetaceae bacterium]